MCIEVSFPYGKCIDAKTLLKMIHVYIRTPSIFFCIPECGPLYYLYPSPSPHCTSVYCTILLPDSLEILATVETVKYYS